MIDQNEREMENKSAWIFIPGVYATQVIINRPRLFGKKCKVLSSLLSLKKGWAGAFRQSFFTLMLIAIIEGRELDVAGRLQLGLEHTPAFCIHCPPFAEASLPPTISQHSQLYKSLFRKIVSNAGSPFGYLGSWHRHECCSVFPGAGCKPRSRKKAAAEV